MRSPFTLRPAPPSARHAVALITLPDGILIERAGRAIAHVDVSDGGLVLRLEHGPTLRCGISTGGIDDAVATVTLAVRRALGQGRRRSAAGLQGQLFATTTDVLVLGVGPDVGPDVGPVVGPDVKATGDRLQARVREAILGRCRAAAHRRDARIDEVAARVHEISKTPIVYSAAVLDTPWLIDDVLRFRAAAVAVAMAETLPPPTRADSGVRALIPLLTRWRSLFAKDGHVTRSVHKTLALLDERAFADVDPRDVWRLREVPLVQPIASPRHLRLLGERQALGGPHLERDLRLLQLVDDDALDEATGDIARSLRLHRVAGRQLEHILCEVLGQAGSRAGDERLPASRAVHVLIRRRLDAVDMERRRARVAGVAAVAVAPPIPLPVDPRLRFLVTEDDFLAEGERMHHCVGTYFSAAVAGDGYFFHFDDDVGRATVRVGRCGQIVEANGVCNTQNATVKRAARLLSTWGAPLSVMSLGDDEACLWHGDGPRLVEGDWPLRTLADLSRAIALELDTGTVKDVVVYLDMVRGTAERVLRGEGWMYFDPETNRVRALAAIADDAAAGRRP